MCLVLAGRSGCQLDNTDLEFHASWDEESFNEPFELGWNFQRRTAENCGEIIVR
jgi:hypothetical protein